MKKIASSAIITIVLLAHFSCIKAVQPNLPAAESVLVVEAFLDNILSEQTITLSQTQPFFDTTPTNEVTGAQVRLDDEKGNTYFFRERRNSDGKVTYTWQSPVGEPIDASEDDNYTLTIEWQGEMYQATSRIRRVPTIKGVLERDKRIEFFADDFLGRGDIYRVQLVETIEYVGPDPDPEFILAGEKSRKISIHRSSVATDSDFIYDAAFGEGTSSLNLDGVEFLPSVRIISNPKFDSLPLAVDYVIRKSIELHAFTPETAVFLEGVRDQKRRGNDADDAAASGVLSSFFASPPFNVYSNIKNRDPEGKRALGNFNVSNVSSRVYSTIRF